MTIFGKSWDIHVRDVLKISLEDNLRLIEDSLRYLKAHVAEVFFDAEHFFDGFKANREYALKVLQHAAAAGADCIVLCDTNGGTLPHDVREMVTAAAKATGAALGIHAHNDGDLAVANALIAVQSGCRQVQGSINGYGERCGNANLCSIIPNLKLKMGIDCVSDEAAAQTVRGFTLYL